MRGGKLLAFGLHLLGLVMAKSEDDTEGDQPPCPIEMPNGWIYCGSQTDLFHLHSFTLTPDPPKRSSVLRIRINGFLDEPLTTGTVNYTVHYGIIPVVKDSKELCDALRQEPKIPQCPLRSGKWNVTHELELPRGTPFGRYSVQASGWSQDGRRIFCVKGTTSVGLFQLEDESLDSGFESDLEEESPDYRDIVMRQVDFL